MTEEEAKTKWCPLASTVREGLGSTGRILIPLDKVAINRWGDNGKEGPRCLASGCMAWQWVLDEDLGETTGWCGLVKS